MRKSGKYIGIVVGVLILVVFSSGCISVGELVKNLKLNKTGNSNISAYGVSFNYPRNWYAYYGNKTGIPTILVVKDPYNQSNPSLMVQIEPNPPGMSDQEAISADEMYPIGWTKISGTILKIDGKIASEKTFRVNDSHYDGLMKDQEIEIVKNGKTYSLGFMAPYNDFDKEKPHFDLMLNSFKVQ